MTIKWTEFSGGVPDYKLVQAQVTQDIGITLAFNPHSDTWRLWCSPFYPNESLNTPDLEEAKRLAILWVRMKVKLNHNQLEALRDGA